MLTKDYIMPLVGGRLGNNLFMIAHAYAKGLEYNKQVVVYQPHVIYHGNDYSKNIFRGLEFISEYEDNCNYNLLIPSDDKPTFYFGYYQSETYFEKYSENIKSLFGPPLEFVERIKTELPFLFTKKVTLVNVRRGDYLHSPNYHPVITPEYVNVSLKHIPHTDVHLIASDDLEWCKENLHLPNPYLLEGYKPEEQLWILSMCHNFVLSNSSFSWWAAYLCRHANKIVVAPETWFGPEFLGQWSNMYCKDWIIQPTYFENGKILPK
jgi:Glycosyl transferase family 11